MMATDRRELVPHVEPLFDRKCQVFVIDHPCIQHHTINVIYHITKKYQHEILHVVYHIALL